MAIRLRRGLKADFDSSKLISGELAIITDVGELHYCFSPGNVKQLVTSDDVINILNSSEEAYTALQQLITDLNNNPSELTNILNNIIGLQNDKLDKTGDSKDNTVTFTEASTLANIGTGESHLTHCGKIKKFFSFIGTTALTTTAQTISAAINELVSGKIDKTSVATNDTVNDTTKVLGANVGYALGQEIDALSLSKLSVIGVAIPTDPNTAPVGIFYFNGTVNAPSFFAGDKSGYCLCMQYSIDYIVQFAMSFNNDSIAFRRKLSGTWQDWVEK